MRCWRSRHYEIKWTAFGTVVGLVVGTFVGGVGIALFGSAWGVPGMLLFAMMGAVVGDRIGVEHDKNALGKAPPR
ncbi:MAG: hypothetical protein QOF14_3793 [Hyphomicrobiales bacterium]|nr:hypothetical protein [Hyphomicrobiales bacterium]